MVNFLRIDYQESVLGNGGEKESKNSGLGEAVQGERVNSVVLFF